jgi:hypothetical protein
MVLRVPVGRDAPTGDPGARSLPYRDTRRTVAAIIAFAKTAQVHVPLRELVESVCRQIRPKAYMSEAAAWLYWLSNPANLRYMRDPILVELVRSVERTLRNRHRTGVDCDDQDALAVAGLLLMGFPVRVMTVGFRPRSATGGLWAFTHVLCACQDAKTGRWGAVDPVAGPRTQQMLRRVRQARVYEIR